jgi:predicted deacetylase
MSARYLIRFDDVCPTMNWPIWQRVEQILLDSGVKPILAVVPDNQDPKLRAAEPNAAFWNTVRTWQMRGWTIGWHGYQHLPVTQSGGILKLSKWSEFSGLTLDEQRSKLRRAYDVFEHQGVRPEVWVAPGHSFDTTTLQALRDIGMRHLSDGFSLYPYRDSSAMMWVPQQLWHFRKMPFGIWTVCLHVNLWTSSDVARLGSDLQEFSSVTTDWQAVASLYRQRRRSWVDRMFSKTYPTALRIRRWLAETS